MQSARFVAFLCLPHYEVAHVDYVAQLAYLPRRFRAFEQPLGLLIEDIQAVPRAVTLNSNPI